MPSFQQYWYVYALVIIAVIGLAIGIKNYRKSHPTYPDFKVEMPGVKRIDVRYGFYASYGDQVNETKGFTNLHWESFYDSYEKGIENIQAFSDLVVCDFSRALFGPRQADGMIPLNPDAAQNLISMINQLNAAGVLGKIKVAVLLDEPNLNTSRIEYETAVRLWKAVTEQMGVQMKLGVIYMGNNTEGTDYWAFNDHDIVGFDDYKRGNYIFAPGEEYERMRSILKPNQMMWLVPGAAQTKGATPQDPATFEAVFHRDPWVWGIIPFLWADMHGMVGVRSTPTQREKYIKLGYSLLWKAP